MPNKFVGAFKFLTKGARKNKVAPTITQPRQLKTTMKRIQSENKRFGFTKAKTATDRANIVRRKKSIERMDKLEKAKSKVKTGEKGKKEIQKLVDTGQADRVGSGVYHRGIREKKAMGGPALGRDMDRLKRGLESLKKRQELRPRSKPKPKPMGKPKPSLNIKKRKEVQEKNKKFKDIFRERKVFGGILGKDKKKKKEEKESKKGTKPKDLIYAPKKMERLKQLREELGKKKGGPVGKPKKGRSKKFPDLTGDGKVTQADILKGRGVFRKGGASK